MLFGIFSYKSKTLLAKKLDEDGKYIRLYQKEIPNF